MEPLNGLDDFIGQEKHIQDLRIHISRAWAEDEVLGHCAFYGPPGLGKTTLARLVANELGSAFYEVAGRQLSKKIELEDLMFRLSKGDIIFIDEAHSLRRAVVEMLYSPMQDFKFKDFDIEPFTMIVGTTHMGVLPKPLRDRIVHDYEFTLYSVEQITQILLREEIPEDVAKFIAKRSKGVPRHAVNFLTKVKGYAFKAGEEKLTLAHCKAAFDALEIDDLGLNRRDRLLLDYLSSEMAIDRTRAIGQDVLSNVLDIAKEDYIHMIEPHLLKEGLIKRTGKGRIITKIGFELVRKKEGKGIRKVEEKAKT